ncbi:imidazole glycerol phosphate synthase subunit HisH [Granulicoccus phenolivorans]|uniref:imidazole glycerol phosphate synthase subunit HisH n=1 Tax=Granulicoccus phenolivorans TaxID=266854 RepID=UPI00040EF1EE|nr:imidazole glycerol phosphate synthase subunit HisH [Granulicoccus phenolivorans]
MSASIALLDYGSGNLRSAYRALLRTGAEVTLTSDPAVAAAADGLVVPGVGAYAACMAGLAQVGGVEVIRDRVAHGRPVLGICVGHQVLFESGIEHGVAAAGVGVLPGVVEQLQTQRLPHMGWNEVDPPAGSILFAGVADQRFYFVHSYAVRAADFGAATDGITWATHESDRFVAAVERGPICSTQFHPEKSGDAGAVVLANWVSTVQS